MSTLLRDFDGLRHRNEAYFLPFVAFSVNFEQQVTDFILARKENLVNPLKEIYNSFILTEDSKHQNIEFTFACLDRICY